MRVLVIQLYQTGDVVLSTHIPRELKKLTDAQVDFLTFEANRPVLENSPYISKILTIRRNEGFLKFIKFISEVRAQKYDAVIDLHNNPRSAYITFLSGAKKRITYGTTKRKIFYNILPERLGGRAGQIKLSLLQPFTDKFDQDSFDYKPEIFPSEKSNRAVDKILTENGISKDDLFVTMSPTHKRATRRWRMEHFMDTARHLTEKHGAKVMLTYGPGEKDYILNNAPQMPSNVFLMPELALDDFVALVGHAKLHIGNDSAPHHIATAQNVPTFIILGSSNDGWVYGSSEHTSVMLGLKCQPCGKAECRISPDIPCMKDLNFEMIREKLDNFINEIILP